MQTEYEAAVGELNAAALEVLQSACIAIHSCREDMDALLFAHEMSELGSTLGHVALSAAAKGWALAERSGANPASRHGAVNSQPAINSQ